MRVRMGSAVLVVLCCLPVSLVAQDTGGMIVVAAKTSKFVNLPGLPACMTVAVLRGDPSKGPSTMMLNFTPGCVVPWHWHTWNEQLLLLSGKGKADMKDGKPIAMIPGDYASLPAKNVHQFTALTATRMFLIPEGAFDIHYVDKDGNEVPPDQPLKPAAKKPAPAKSSSKP